MSDKFEIFYKGNQNYSIVDKSTNNHYSTNIKNRKLIALRDSNNNDILNTRLGQDIKNVLIACGHIDGFLKKVFLK